MNNKRKNRPTAPRYFNDRPQRGRSVQAEGIYNNSFFMHAATSIVGSLVQVQTHSGSIYEGVFHTFSPNFDVVLELAQCIKDSQNQNSDEIKSIYDCMIFHPDHIVSIVTKDFDTDSVTEGIFQTDSAISARCNGSRSEEKELEPWDPSGSAPNGDINLELDGNANGWDVNDMFNKNEKLYGVQTTFDDSLAGYTVQIEKKNTEDYKAAEEKAEKIAQEIESQPKYQERLELENGDEEQRFAAVERPNDRGSSSDLSSSVTSLNTAPNTPVSVSVSPSSSNQLQQQHQQQQQQQPPPLQQQQQQHSQHPQHQQHHPPPPHYQQQHSNTSTSSSNSNQTGSSGRGGDRSLSNMQSSKGPNAVVDKYIPPSKRKNMQPGGNKLVRNTPPPNNNGPMSQHNSHSTSKSSNYQSIQMQSSQQYINQNYSHMHGHIQNMSQSKLNGDGSNNSSNNKPLPQRGIRPYSQQSSASGNSYADQQQSSMGGQMNMGKPPMHASHNHSHVNVGQHLSNNIQDTSPLPPTNQTGHIVGGHHVVMTPGPPVAAAPTQNQPPPQPQRPQRGKEEQLESLRKFQQDFHLANSNSGPSNQQQQQHQSQMNQVKTPSVSPHQPPQPSLSPPHHQHSQQQLSPMPQHSQQLPPPQQPPPPHQHQHTLSHHQQHHQQQQMPPPQQQTTQHSQQQQTDNSPPMSKQKSSQHIQGHIVAQQQQEQQNYQPSPRQQSPPTIISSSSMAPPSNSPPQQQAQQIVNANSNASGSDSNSTGDKAQTPGPAKKPFTLNPTAKPFTPRSPSTPNPSRPHTPQTPGPALTPGVYTPSPHMTAGQPPIMYVTQQPAFQTAPHPHAGQQGRLRRAPVTASQMQVSAAAATGAPLLTAPTIQQFIHYQQAHPPHFQSQAYQPMIPQMRMFHEAPPQQVQFLTAQTPPSTTPSPGQPHQQFHPGPQPSPAGGGPPPSAYGPATAQPQPHLQMVCPVLTGHPQLVPNYYQGAVQTPHPPQQFHVIMQQQHPAQ